MDPARIEAITAWLSQHPLAAGIVIFLIAFCDALVIVGVAVPAVPLLFAVGTLVGLGHIDGWYALVCASLGAFCGDGVSFWVGRRYGTHLQQMWPFRKHPEWLHRGEITFRRHGAKSIFMARYIGAIRPFVPAIAGMLRMPVPRYVAPSAVVCVLWSATFLGPGWIFGTSLDLVSAIAGRLSLVLGALIVLIALIWACVYYPWRWFGPRAAGLIERALQWSHRHPVLGRYSEALIDPNRPESASLLFLASALVVAGWGFFTLIISVGGGAAPSALDLAVHHGMFALRNPLADQALAFFATLGDAAVLLPAIIGTFLWLWWRRRHAAAWHWLAAPAFAFVLAHMLGWLIDIPPPPAATMAVGFGFPSATVTLATVVYGFFAVLIARELPGRRRVWPYMVAALLVGLLGFSRLYLGAHWLSDVLAGICLGCLWVAVLGIAYRRRMVRSFWVKPTAAVFFGLVIAAGLWHGANSAESLRREFAPPLVRQSMAMSAWQQGGWAQRLPARRNELRGRDAWPLNVQVAGSLDGIRARFVLAGWEPYQPGGWMGLLQILDKDAQAHTLPILPATHEGRAEALMLIRPGDDERSRLLLRLWPAAIALEPGAQPLWIGSAQTVRFIRRFDFLSYWEVQAGDDAALLRLRSDAGSLVVQEVTRSDHDRVLLMHPR